MKIFETIIGGFALTCAGFCLGGWYYTYYQTCPAPRLSDIPETQKHAYCELLQPVEKEIVTQTEYIYLTPDCPVCYDCTPEMEALNQSWEVRCHQPEKEKSAIEKANPNIFRR
jgi:hypothetical protein